MMHDWGRAGEASSGFMTPCGPTPGTPRQAEFVVNLRGMFRAVFGADPELAFVAAGEEGAVFLGLVLEDREFLLGGSGRDQGRDVFRREGVESEVGKQRVQACQRHAGRGGQLDSDGASVGSPVDQEASTALFDPIAMIVSPTRKVKIRRQRLATSECDFQITLLCLDAQ